MQLFVCIATCSNLKIKLLQDKAGGDSFIGEGFKNWKKKDKLLSHVGDHNSAHNKTRHKCEDLMKTKEQSLPILWLSKDERNKKDYRLLLTTAVDCVRFLLRQGLSFRGHDESPGSDNRGLKALILNDNTHAFYVHCFAHQLQLCLVAVAKNHWHAKHLFEITSRIVNTVGASCKRSDALRAIQHDKILFHLSKGELSSGRGLNQETSLQRAGDTRWGSHFHTLISLKKMYASVIEVLEIIKEDGVHDQQAVESGVTNELSQALQRKDQDIVNAMKLVQISKQQLQIMRDNGWNFLLEEVSRFCNVFEVVVPVMSSTFKTRRRSTRRNDDVTNLHHYRVEFFYTIIDMQLQELNNRLSEASTELLLCISCLNPSNSFSAYNKEKLIRLAELYSADFSVVELVALEHQLSTYILDMHTSEEFSSLESIVDLAK
ncbi:zinc finger MYM-type protein 1-like [Dendrobium catenatum]|uniref:zinc finger MYM-type protein 1-like n=1 Tax=Dendrobium catenatum TaxID=906689 RepID=UPI00109FE67D|nr:zinc finger MYM-type protein 1-like [Dendrobium catenatum]